MPKRRSTIFSYSLAALSFSTSLTFANHAMAANKPEDKELSHLKETTSLRLEATKGALQKDILILSTRIDSQDKRLESQNSHIDQSLNILNTLLSGLGIVLALGGLAGYFSVQNKAKKEAQSEAKKTANDWFKTHTDDLQARIDTLQVTLRSLESQAESSFNSHMDMLKTNHDLVEQAMQKLQTSLSDTQKSSEEKPFIAEPALTVAAQATKNKAENDFDYQDWNYLAFDAFQRGDKERAVSLWSNAANMASATLQEKAQALLNAGNVLSQLKRYAEAIQLFDDVIELLEKSPTADAHIQISKALNAKAVSFGHLEKYDRALKTCEEMLHFFQKNEKRADLVGYFIEACYNKAISLDKLNRLNDALPLYEEVFEKYKTHDDPKIRYLAAYALINSAKSFDTQREFEKFDSAYEKFINTFGHDDSIEVKDAFAVGINSKGFSLLCRAKAQWQNTAVRITQLENAFNYFTDASKIRPHSSIILGNLAYCSHLQNKSEEVVTSLLERSMDLGGREIFEATLADLQVHPLGEIDDAFRQLLDSSFARFEAAGDSTSRPAFD